MSQPETSIKEINDRFSRQVGTLITSIAMVDAANVLAWFEEQESLPIDVICFCRAVRTLYADYYLDKSKEVSQHVRESIRFEEGGEMTPTQMEGQEITVTYRSDQKLSEKEARELIQSKAPSGFTIQNVELNESQGS